jgi:hypothetical protein
MNKPAGGPQPLILVASESLAPLELVAGGIRSVDCRERPRALVGAIELNRRLIDRCALAAST